jgi:uncharacterized protein (TIGR02145 family)
MNISNAYNSNASPYFKTIDETCNPCGPKTGHGGIQGICPEGFHIPSDLEWNQYEYCLESAISPTGSTPLSTFQNTQNFRGSTTAGVGPGSKMKATNWGDGAWSTNASGFTALPGGSSMNGSSYGMGTFDAWWSDTEVIATAAWYHEVNYGLSGVDRNNIKAEGLSVRCMQD